MNAIRPGTRVVLRPGATYGREGSAKRHIVPATWLSVTPTRPHQSYLPHAAYEWEGKDAQGRVILFMAADAEAAGPLP